MYNHSSLVDYLLLITEMMTTVMTYSVRRPNRALATSAAEANADIIRTLTFIRSTLLLAALITAQRAS